jgi:hypothetical protein
MLALGAGAAAAWLGAFYEVGIALRIGKLGSWSADLLEGGDTWYLIAHQHGTRLPPGPTIMS